jgi:hypothetical protein
MREAVAGGTHKHERLAVSSEAYPESEFNVNPNSSEGAGNSDVRPPQLAARHWHGYDTVSSPILRTQLNLFLAAMHWSCSSNGTMDAPLPEGTVDTESHKRPTVSDRLSAFGGA